MSDDERTHIPSNPPAEWAAVVARAAVSLIPFAGGPAAEVLGAIIQPVIERRKTEWLEGIAKGLDDLSKQVADLTPERLAQDEAFTTAFLHASQIAVTTHQQEILDALRNAVLNVAVGDGPDYSLQTILLDAINTLTPWHIWLLECIADPVGWANARKYPIATPPPDPVTMLEAFYRGQMPAEGFQEYVFQSLYNLGLTTTNTMPAGLPTGSLVRVPPRITDLGNKFLAFIAEPRMPETPAADEKPA